MIDEKDYIYIYIKIVELVEASIEMHLSTNKEMKVDKCKSNEATGSSQMKVVLSNEIHSKRNEK